MQNELIHARELMTVICVFSSAPLVEKGKFLQALFDDSHTGLCTAAEIVSILHMVLAVLTKCTGIPCKVKEVRDQLKRILPELLPTWADALERCHGKSEVAFTSDRFIGQIEMEQLLPSLMETYETLPIAGPPPPGALQPPPPDWATPSALEKGSNKTADAPKPAAGPSAKALGKAELAHLDWISRMDDEADGEGLSPTGIGNSQERVGTADAARGWMVIYGTDFSAVAKNLASFRHLFMRSVATALGMPMGCIEVVNITRSSGTIIEFLLSPSGRGADTRDGETLKQALSQQLALPHSALRKGPFKDYVASAELVERPQKNRPRGAGNASATAASSSTARDLSQATQPGREGDEEIQIDGEKFVGTGQLKAKIEQILADSKSKDNDMQEVLQDLEKTEGEARQWQKRAEGATSELEKLKTELAELRGNAT